MNKPRYSSRAEMAATVRAHFAERGCTINAAALEERKRIAIRKIQKREKRK